jgi:hypothetical protein
LTVAKGGGFSKDNRVRARQKKTLDVYAELAPATAGDPAKDRGAMIEAIERGGGYTKYSRDETKVAAFMRLWKSDEARAYLCELWGLAIDEERDQDPVSLAMRLLHTHATQTDESWGPRDRGASLTAVRLMTNLFIPQQTTKIASVHMSTKIERPATYDQEPVMESRSILPAGTKIATPTGPTGADDDDDEDEDE